MRETSIFKKYRRSIKGASKGLISLFNAVQYPSQNSTQNFYIKMLHINFYL